MNILTTYEILSVLGAIVLVVLMGLGFHWAYKKWRQFWELWEQEEEERRRRRDE